MAEYKDREKSSSRSRKNLANGGGNVPLMDVVMRTLQYWYWVVASVVVCVGVTYAHFLRIPDTYTRSAEILIKDDFNSQNDAISQISGKKGYKNKTNIANEIVAIQSQDLMEEVARRLSLNINYYRPGRFHDEVAYGFNLPVKVEMPDAPEESTMSFLLEVGKNGGVKISNFIADGRAAEGKVYTGKLNQPISTIGGKLTVKPTSTYVSGEKIELIVSKTRLSSARDALRRLSVTISNEEASVLKLMLTDQSIERADEILNTFINVYNENWVRDKNQIAVSTSNFINDRLGVIEHELGNVEDEISSFKSANLMPDIQGAVSMYMSQNQEATQAIVDLSTQKQMMSYIRSYIADAKGDQLLPANTGASGNIQGLITSYNDKLLQRNALIAKSSDKNPLVIAMDEQMAAQRHAMIRTIDNEIVAMNNQLRTLQNTGAQARSHIASNPGQAKYLLSVERQQKVKESLYLFLLQRREENELNQAFTAYNTRIINKPGYAGVPTLPNRKRTLMMAFLLGLLLPFGVTYVYEFLNTKVRGRKDIEDVSAPFLGEIPLYPHNREKMGLFKSRLTNAIVVKEGTRDVINEAFRVLRTNLEFMKINRPGADVIAMTSFNPGSGKSFLTMNLAISLSIKGKRVLVIDGDMRHGSTSSYIKSPEIGLSDYLTGNVNDISSIIKSDANMSSLQIIPVGTVPPNPTELLESPRFEILLDKLRPDYDYIFIDCPPIEVVADAQIIDHLADRTIFVLRAGLLQRAMLPELEKLYEERRYKNMAIILNGTTAIHSRTGYGYRYGYGYGYGYRMENNNH